MKGKLIKGKNSGEYMINLEGVGYVTTYESTLPHKLSLKNCQAIERGYDLMKLAEENSHKYYDVKTTDWHCNYNGFFSGFQKALEILGDKKFSEKDITKAYNKGQMLNIKGRLQTGKNYVKSLQQTEWDVIVETKKVIDETKIVGSVKGVKGSGNKINTYKSVPKLDDDGCLILKRI